MNNRTRLAVAALSLAALYPLATSTTAQAKDPKADHSPCVANRESHGQDFGVPRAEVEKRWEVTGRGENVTVLGWPAVAYPWCGHKFHDHSATPAYYVGAVYSGRGKLRAILWVKPPVDLPSQPEPTLTVDPSPTSDPTPTADPTPCTKGCPLY